MRKKYFAIITALLMLTGCSYNKDTEQGTQKESITKEITDNDTVSEITINEDSAKVTNGPDEQTINKFYADVYDYDVSDRSMSFNDIKTHNYFFSDSLLQECLVEKISSNEFFTQSEFIFLCKEQNSKWEYKWKGTLGNVKITDIDNDDYVEVYSHFTNDRTSAYTLKILNFGCFHINNLFTMSENPQGENILGFEDIKKGELLLDNTQFELKDTDKDKIKELIVKFDRLYALEDWYPDVSELSFEDFRRKHCLHIKHDEVYKLDKHRYELKNDNCEIKAFSQSEDYVYDVSFDDFHFNELYDEISIEIKLNHTDKETHELQLIAKLSEYYDSELELVEFFNESVTVGKEDNFLHEFELRQEYLGCRNLYLTVLQDKKVIQHRVIHFDCGE